MSQWSMAERSRNSSSWITRNPEWTVYHTHTHLKALRLWPKPSLEDVVVALLTAAVFLFLGLLQGSNNPREVLNSLNKPNKSMPVANGADLPGVAVQCFWLVFIIQPKNRFGGLVANSCSANFRIFWESISLLCFTKGRTKPMKLTSACFGRAALDSSKQ